MQVGFDLARSEIEADFSSMADIRVLYEDFLSHPKWNEICIQYSKDVLAAFSLHPQMAKLVSTDARTHACNAIIARYYGKQAESGREGLTLSEVHEAGLAGSLITSRNRIAGLVKIMQYAGLATVTVSEIDARQRLFRFTELGHFAARQFRHAIMNCIDLTLGTDYLERSEASCSTLTRFYKRAVDLFITSGFSAGVFPAYGTLVDVTAGPETLHYLYLASEECEHSRLVVTTGFLAQQRGVSRAQMRRIIQECMALGLVRTYGLGGRELEVLPALRELLLKLCAMRFAIMARAAIDVVGVPEADHQPYIVQ